jgi:hypothetical protein
VLSAFAAYVFQLVASPACASLLRPTLTLLQVARIVRKSQEML